LIGGFTLWYTNIAIENCPFIVDLPIKNGDFLSFLYVYQRVTHFNPRNLWGWNMVIHRVVYLDVPRVPLHPWIKTLKKTLLVLSREWMGCWGLLG